jgi:hypothetical protein
MALVTDGLTDIGFGPGLTTHFWVFYQDNLAKDSAGNIDQAILANLKANANALLAVIENEFTVTTAWFGTPAGKFDLTTRQVVNLANGDISGSSNGGYLTPININGQPGNSDISTAGPIVCAHFMLEWVEILMSLTVGKDGLSALAPRWTAGNSVGEGLSHFCGLLRFPAGHDAFYTRPGGQVFVENWLNGTPNSPMKARSDWVNTTYFGGQKDSGGNPIKGDADPVSYGCALAFLFWLYSRLGYGVHDIIAAGDADKGTLAAVYKTLSGYPDDPFTEFSELFETFYPSSQTATLPDPIPDNPFTRMPYPSIRRIFPGAEGVLYALMDNGDLRWYRNNSYQFGTGTWARAGSPRVGKGWNVRHIFSGGAGLVYAILDNGDLLWYQHDGSGDGTFNWANGSGNRVGVGWNQVRIAFGAGNGIIYAVLDNGDLYWYHHIGFGNGTDSWGPGTGNKVGNNWTARQVFTVGSGVIYATAPNGDLMWYKHLGWQDGTRNWVNEAGAKVGVGWDAWQIASFGDGYIYAANDNGDLYWYQHTGWSNGTDSWHPASGAKVGSGWNFCPVIYSVTADGALRWYRHDGWGTGAPQWTLGGGQRVGSGWNTPRIVFPGGKGVVYAVQANGDLFWYRHDGWAIATIRWTDPTGVKVGNGWSDARIVFPGGDGIIYAVKNNGDLQWYRHDGWTDGAVKWTHGDGGVKVGNGWGNARIVFSAGNGVIYAVLNNGDLQWYRHDGWADGAVKWTHGDGGVKVGGGWSATHVFPGTGGVIYAVQPNGDLLWYRHDGWTDATNRWTHGEGAKVGGGWNVLQAFAM